MKFAEKINLHLELTLLADARQMSCIRIMRSRYCGLTSLFKPSTCNDIKRPDIGFGRGGAYTLTG